MNVLSGPFMMKLAGFVGPDRCPFAFRFLFIDDKKALKGFFEQLAAMPKISTLVPCHGDIRTSGAREALSKLAATV
jgi:hypothetical protein